MRENSIAITYKENPVLLDKVLQEIQSKLEKGLPWLTHAFGKSYAIAEEDSEGRKIKYPAVYNNNGEYLSMLPNDNLGNFSWFDIYDPQHIDNTSLGKQTYTYEGAIIFWFDASTIYNSDSHLYIEEIKNEIISLIMSPGFLTNNSKISIVRVFEQIENIYRGYINFVNDKQYFMFPFAGLRLEFKLTTKESCKHF